MIKVAVFGAQGRMGQQVCQAVRSADDLELVAQIDVDDDPGLADAADVAVDFTNPDAVGEHITWCVSHGVNIVVGTSGFDAARLARVAELSAAHPSVGVLIVPNFAIGAVLMMKFAALAAPFFASTEIIELHHPNKVDAPSGTALNTAHQIAAARAEHGLGEMPDATTSELGGARGSAVDGVHIHSVRLAGLNAHQEVLLGAPGETLTIRHDSFDRASFMPGVLLAVRQVGQRPGLTVGLDALLGL